MPRPIWWNGTLHSKGASLLSPGCQGLQWGRGVFETIAVARGLPLALTRHLHRLTAGAERLGLLPPADESLHAGIHAVLADCPPHLHRLRLTLTGPAGRGLDLSPVPGDCLIEATEVPDSSLLETARLLTVPWRRNEWSPLAGVKSTSYAENAVALAHATAQGATEALLLNASGALCEGSTSNLFLVRSGCLYTPPLRSGCLPGITRELVIELSGKQGIPCYEQTLLPEEVQSHDQFFLTSSLRGIQPVTHWDHRVFPSRCALTAHLRSCLTQWLSDSPDP